MYAAGKIPGSFFKREGRAGEKATLSARLIDRPIRPLFPKGWRYETQLVAIPISVDHVNPYDILAMNGASAALMLSHIPFPTPVGAVRIGKIDGNFVVNPAEELFAESDLDLVVAGTDEAILMVEAGANEVPEAEILDALDIAHGEIRKLVAVMRDLGEKAAPKRRSARSRSRSSRCRARTARRCSPAARPRPSPWSPSAPRARRCGWTRWGWRPPSATSTTTTSRRSPSARRASCAVPSA